MDMSATELAKAPCPAGALPVLGTSIAIYPGRWVSFDARAGHQTWPTAERFRPVSSPPHPAVSSALAIALLWLTLAGCGIHEPGVTPTTTPPRVAGTRNARALTPVTQSPDAQAGSAQPASRLNQRASDPKHLPATSSKGAERLLATRAPAAVPATREAPLSTVPPEKNPPATQVSTTVTGVVAKELVFHGSPPEIRPKRTGMKALVWLGLGFGAAALAILVRLYLIRRTTLAEFSEAGKDEVKMPRELLFKEPLNLPPEPAMADQPSSPGGGR